jgi:hypothetical protein
MRKAMPVLKHPVESRINGGLAERALVLTVATLILLTPPILTIFDVPLTVIGIPLLQVYCFAVWLAAIALGGWLAKRMDAPSVAADRGAPAADEG